MVNETLKKLYNELIYQLLVEEQVEKIVCNRKSGDNRFFDDLYVDKEKGLVIVHNHGLKMDFDGFCFDFTVDYAACLAQIEKAIFLASRRSKETEGLVITFSKEKQDYINDDSNFVTFSEAEEMDGFQTMEVVSQSEKAKATPANGKLLDALCAMDKVKNDTKEAITEFVKEILDNEDENIEFDSLIAMNDGEEAHRIFVQNNEVFIQYYGDGGCVGLCLLDLEELRRVAYSLEYEKYRVVM